MTRSIQKEDVHQRIQDWEHRLDSLYRQLTDWLGPDDALSARGGLPVLLYQEVMMYFSIPTRELPTLDILHGNRLLLTVKPVALWLVGGNGRADLLVRGRKAGWYLLDHARPFDPPDWRLYRCDEELPGYLLTRDRFRSLLAELV